MPGPGEEKKTENGVWLDAGDGLLDSRLLESRLLESRTFGKATGRAAVGADGLWGAPSDMGLGTAAETFGAANCADGICGMKADHRSDTGGEFCAFKPSGKLPAPVSAG